MTTILEQLTTLAHNAAVNGRTFDSLDFDIRAYARELKMRPRALSDALQAAYQKGRQKTAVVRYTTAQADYDWFGTTGEVAGTDAGNGKVWRRVRILPERLRCQSDRYGSGLHACFEQDEFNKLVAAKLVKLA